MVQSGDDRGPMSKKQTHEEFVDYLRKKNTHFRNGEIEILGKYTNVSEPILCRCIKHGDYYARPRNLLKGNRGCHLCNPCHLKTREEFTEQLRRINPDIELVGSYVRSSTKTDVRCRKCGYTWKAKPNTLQQGSGCPRCARTGTSRSEQYLCVFMEQVFGIESVLNRDKTSIGLELDVVCGKHAWEYGSWFWHKPKRKQAIDLEKYE